jgi:hypothetical protein
MQDLLNCWRKLARHTKALLLWDRNKLPIDIDRNWLTVSEVDIDYYCSFLNSNRNKQVPSSISQLQEVNNSPQKFLMDSDDRDEIAIIKIKGLVESVQQKNLVKVLTTSNAGEIRKIRLHRAAPPQKDVLQN